MSAYEEALAREAELRQERNLTAMKLVWTLMDRDVFLPGDARAYLDEAVRLDEAVWEQVAVSRGFE